MSESTSGYVFLASDKAKLKTALKSLDETIIPFMLQAINEKYHGLFVDELRADNNAVRNWVIETSKQVPIMYFYHSEDYGWGYELYVSGQVNAKLDCDYEADDNDVPAMYAQCNPNELAVFRLSSKEIEDLTLVLSDEFYLAEDEDGFYKQVADFQDIIGIPEMEWMSYQYLEADDEEDDEDD